MSVVNMAKTMKTVHPKDIMCFKVGSFYHVYGKDAYIMSYLFGYYMKDTKEEMYEVGSPVNTSAKILARLENEKINYMLIDTRNSYDVDEESDNRNLNTYDEKFEKAYKYIKIKRKIDNIEKELIMQIEQEGIKEKIRKIEDIINES